MALVVAELEVAGVELYPVFPDVPLDPVDEPLLVPDELLFEPAGLEEDLEPLLPALEAWPLPARAGTMAVNAA